MADPTKPRVLIMADGLRPDLRGQTEQFLPLFQQEFEVAEVCYDFQPDIELSKIELVVVCGGDGSILRATRQLGEDQRPIIGVNLGKLGFLAALRPEQLPHTLPQIAAGSYRLIDHLMLNWLHLRGDDEVARGLCLNEVAVLAGPPFTMLNVQLYVDAELVTTYSGDGLIVSTPVGSTAHNLSAGGPILEKSLQALVISPISPHTLTNRPVVDSASRTYELVVPKPLEGTSLVVDGRVQDKLGPFDRVRIERSTAKFQLVEAAQQSYYKTLREKLGWGGQLKFRS